MREADDSPGPLARDLMERATLAGLRENADELAAIVREVQSPLPILPLDASAREMALMDRLWQARDRERRLLAVICD